MSKKRNWYKALQIRKLRSPKQWMLVDFSARYDLEYDAYIDRSGRWWTVLCYAKSLKTIKQNRLRTIREIHKMEAKGDA